MSAMGSNDTTLLRRKISSAALRAVVKRKAFT
jgi:hypothetical protein